jgi:hypothetical protein
MGSRLYDFLADSFLFDDSLIQDKFQSMSDSEVWTELQRYRQFCLSVASELEAEVLSNNSSLKLFSGIKQVSIPLLKQSAFYVQQHVLYDPLFALTHTPTEQTKAMNEFLGMRDTPFDKAQVARTLHYLKELTPMIASDYVKLLPTSYLLEPPQEVPFTHSENGFRERVPQSLHDFVHRQAIVESGKKVEGGIQFDGGFEIGRLISVRFKDHGFEDSYGYALTAQKVIEINRETGIVKFGMTLPDTPSNKATFDDWVYQSINQAAGGIYQRILLENILCVRFDAFYLTNSPFIFELLEQIVPVEDSILANTVNVLLKMNLPFLDGVDIESLMRVRSQDGEAFDNFRLELDKQLRELRQVKDPNVLKTRTENVMHELAEVQIHRLEKKIGSLKKKFFAEAAVVAASLYGAVQSGGWTLPLALLAAFQGYKALTEYQRQRDENPAFFLWRVFKDSRKV